VIQRRGHDRVLREQSWPAPSLAGAILERRIGIVLGIATRGGLPLLLLAAGSDSGAPGGVHAQGAAPVVYVVPVEGLIDLGAAPIVRRPATRRPPRAPRLSSWTSTRSARA
jgi:hypothetical protein